MIRLEYEDGGIRNYENRDIDLVFQEFILNEDIQKMIFNAPSKKVVILVKYIKDKMIRYEIKSNEDLSTKG